VKQDRKHHPKLRKPKFEGDRIENLFCPCGWCNERHAVAVATKLNFGNGEFLAWVTKAPCLEKVERQAMGLAQQVRTLNKQGIAP